MEQSIVARLGCVQGQLHVARARLRVSHEQAQVELAAAQAELGAVLSEVSPAQDPEVKAAREKQNQGGLGPSQVAKCTYELQSNGGWRKVPLGQIRAPGDQSIGDRLDRIQAEVQRQAELRADWDEVQAAWEEVLTDTQILVPVARLQARLAHLQASTAEAQLKALQAQGQNWPQDAREPAQAQAVSGPVLKQVYEQVAAAVHNILVLAMQDLERAKQAQRLRVLSQLTRAVHAQVEVALRGILAKAAQEVAAADRVELAEALCSQVEKAVQDVIVKVEQDWGRPRGTVPGGSEGRGGEAAL